MRHRLVLSAAAGLLIALSSVPSAQAQLLDQLKNAAGAGGGSMGGLGGSSSASSALPPVGQAGVGNTAGLLQYCVQNNFLGQSAAGSVKSSLLSRLPGQSSDSGYQQGSRGTLSTTNGQTFDVGSSGGSGSLKQQVTQKVCDMVLQHGKSLL